MLWNVIITFYIQYIFGGVYFSDELGRYVEYPGILGTNFFEGSYDTDWYTSNIDFFKIVSGDNVAYLSLGNYLSIIATIITMIVIVVLCCQLIKKIYNMCAHVIG